MLLPIILPTLRLGTFLKVAVKEAASSGSDVPIANIVMAIIQGLTLNIVAILTPDWTIKFAPKSIRLIAISDKIAIKTLELD